MRRIVHIIRRHSGVLHPFLFAAFPVLFLFAYNVNELFVADVLMRPFTILFVGTGLLLLVFAAAFKSWEKAAVVTSFFIILFFSFGHAWNALEPLSFSFTVSGGGRITFPFQMLVPWVWGLSVSTAIVFLRNTSRSFQGLTRFLNVVAVALIAFPTFKIGTYALLRTQVPVVEERAAPVAQVVSEDAERELPNIYYIILDGYGRSDILRDRYEFDNAPFISFLKEQGFYVAEKSTANYSQTALSLSSSFRMNYLDDIAKAMGPLSTDRAPLERFWGEGEAIQFLRDQGYRIATLMSTTIFTEASKKADINLTLHSAWSEFEHFLIRSTPVPQIASVLRTVFPAHRVISSQYDVRRENIRAFFSRMPASTDIAPPTFFFMHVLAPHPPFVFDEEGRPVDPDKPYSEDEGPSGLSSEEYRRGYRGQAVFITSEIQKAIQTILKKAGERSVIILQSDHGPFSEGPAMPLNISNPATQAFLRERLSNLNAYYFPNRDYRALYPAITPINSFRVLFNTYFGTEFPRLPDESYFSAWERPYDFTRVTDVVSGPRAVMPSMPLPRQAQ